MGHLRSQVSISTTIIMLYAECANYNLQHEAPINNSIDQGTTVPFLTSTPRSLCTTHALSPPLDNPHTTPYYKPVHPRKTRQQKLQNRVNFLPITSSMPRLPASLGSPTVTCRSNLPGRVSAGSSTSGRFVAATTKTLRPFEKPTNDEQWTSDAIGR